MLGNSSPSPREKQPFDVSAGFAGPDWPLLQDGWHASGAMSPARVPGGILVQTRTDGLCANARRLRSTLISIACSICVISGAVSAECADVALVLALDGSSSIDHSEFELQTSGYYRALTSPDVLAAFSNAGVVEIAAVFWADSSKPPNVIPWNRVATHADILIFAQELVQMERQVAGNTSIGLGIATALSLFEDIKFCAERLVIDISGDGRSAVEFGPTDSLAGSRKKAEERGITINALAITSEDADLAEYYQASVITGTDSFVMEVDGFETFHRAIVEKLIRELHSNALDGHPAATSTSSAS